jgi:hypothetical protein
MTNSRWARVALLALALPACATAAGTTRTETVVSQPGGQAAQPASWLQAQAKPRANYVEHAGARGQAAQPFAWLDSRPEYPVDQHRLAQDGMTYLGGRAGQGGSWTPAPSTSWTLASTLNTRAQQ